MRRVSAFDSMNSGSSADVVAHVAGGRVSDATGARSPMPCITAETAAPAAVVLEASGLHVTRGQLIGDDLDGFGWCGRLHILQQPAPVRSRRLGEVAVGDLVDVCVAVVSGPDLHLVGNDTGRGQGLRFCHRHARGKRFDHRGIRKGPAQRNRFGPAHVEGDVLLLSRY